MSGLGNDNDAASASTDVHDEALKLFDQQLVIEQQIILGQLRGSTPSESAYGSGTATIGGGRSGGSGSSGSNNNGAAAAAAAAVARRRRDAFDDSVSDFSLGDMHQIMLGGPSAASATGKNDGSDDPVKREASGDGRRSRLPSSGSLSQVDFDGSIVREQAAILEQIRREQQQQQQQQELKTGGGAGAGAGVGAAGRAGRRLSLSLPPTQTSPYLEDERARAYAAAARGRSDQNSTEGWDVGLASTDLGGNNGGRRGVGGSGSNSNGNDNLGRPGAHYAVPPTGLEDVDLREQIRIMEEIRQRQTMGRGNARDAAGNAGNAASHSIATTSNDNANTSSFASRRATAPHSLGDSYNNNNNNNNNFGDAFGRRVPGYRSQSFARETGVATTTTATATTAAVSSATAARSCSTSDWQDSFASIGSSERDLRAQRIGNYATSMERQAMRRSSLDSKGGGKPIAQRRNSTGEVGLFQDGDGTNYMDMYGMVGIDEGVGGGGGMAGRGGGGGGRGAVDGAWGAMDFPSSSTSAPNWNRRTGQQQQQGFAAFDNGDGRTYSPSRSAGPLAAGAGGGGGGGVKGIGGLTIALPSAREAGVMGAAASSSAATAAAGGGGGIFGTVGGTGAGMGRNSRSASAAAAATAATAAAFDGDLRTVEGEGCTYRGQYNSDGLRHGKGMLTWENGDRYEGQFWNGMRHGVGKLTFADGSDYDGWWRHNRMHGNGTRRFRNGNVYVGSYSDGKRNGEGRHIFANGDQYVGTFRDDAMHGFGRYYFRNNESFEGTFCQGRKEGRGKYQWADGTVDIVQYANDARVGEGVRYSANRKKAWKLEGNKVKGKVSLEKAAKIVDRLGRDP